ncbi:hypothetical protein HMN09_01258500 [Mycena chlorophos]|uniref:Beta-glucuronidase C-terminal domain-containing protein n=1 Tax=Mycena chlorophos TaxID=658473 RepID=A0A8H6S4H9_MYCCL|nr:hypothetical protein HMN09_01258500 [Mycena chlorophos]
MNPKLLCLILLAFVNVHAQTITVSVPSSAPTAAPTLKPSLFSLSIEQDYWPDWAGTTEPNTFFVNTLENLKNRTGEPPWFRIGANSQDRTDFNPAVQYSETVPVAPSVASPYPEASEVIVGDGFYQIAENLPCGTNVVWGVNLLTNNMTAAFLEAQSIYEAFSSPAMVAAGVTLDSIEIGNEPDLYPGKLNYTSTNWNVSAYIAQWTRIATNLTNSGFVSSEGAKFLGPSWAGVSNAAKGFTPRGIINGGMLSSPAGQLLRTYSDHHYQCGPGEILSDLVVKANVRSNLTQLKPAISLIHSMGLDYVLGETGSCWGHGAVNTSNVGGAAIWTLDYTLFAGTLNISRLFFHQGVGFKYNAIQPVTLTRSILDGSPLSSPLPPHVQPPYHAALVAAEAIGTSGVTTIVELDIDDAAVSGYAFFENGVLKRAVLINLTLFFAASGAARGSKTIALSVTGTVQIKRLFIPSADATTGLVWAGQSFDTEDGLACGDAVEETASADSIVLNDTEALLVTFLDNGGY